jgi:hypothetical protein
VLDVQGAGQEAQAVVETVDAEDEDSQAELS